ncbi:MAG TPA: class I SAM-dependent methyltransferase [Candidatus Limnocylindrales bacterium]
MNHADHVQLIADGVRGAGKHWLELGSGNGEFTLALADVLGDGAQILAADLDRRALADLKSRLGARFPRASVATTVIDMTRGLPAGPFDGVLAANSLHFVARRGLLLGRIRDVLTPGGRLVLVEYDSEQGNPWVPHPISLRRWGVEAPAAGFAAPRLLHRVPSRFLGSIYGAVTTRP